MDFSRAVQFDGGTIVNAIVSIPGSAMGGGNGSVYIWEHAASTV